MFFSLLVHRRCHCCVNTQAIKYTSKGGNITVEMTVGTPEKMTKSVFSSGDAEPEEAVGSPSSRAVFAHDSTTVVDGVWVTFKVVDTGAGLTADQIDLLMKFEPFTQIAGNATVNEDASGLGLGIAREIVSAHGGNLTMTSRGKGHGCSFVIRMPFQLADCQSMNGTSAQDSLTEMEALGFRSEEARKRR
uniref:histidine kinase n=1 Tax=Chromera velia CCMP2878 TaxID=1169474 RepID=A0A0G4HYQ9_9ALVE|eukprot:Cvel_9540.t1-p1 / transcript=Cvel_9540.t1 / gene=Cvel_9540 / organism=Chromera_velia_CCMP2878 / gene_product=Histidine kinase 5, putative / transcript_product=Histidine kinase 5, putative / location=Cvel_scaffold552:76140-77174(-) / protein_length=189 / sequence_SO=supercontig / SO=protein_coding / is_pseudo=false